MQRDTALVGQSDPGKGSVKASFFQDREQRLIKLLTNTLPIERWVNIDSNVT